MHEERELLIKRVFPELRRLCAERFVTFTEVDLRWGITEEQAAEGWVLPICLDEIERSQPFFHLRDPGYLDRLPPGSSRADFACESSEAGEKLRI